MSSKGIDGALLILEYLPNSFGNKSENDYITFLWEAFESNYQHGKYQFAILSYHMLFMSFVYFSVWQIKINRPDDYKKAAIFLANGRFGESDLLGASSPFTLSKLEERTIFRLLRLIGCEMEHLKPFTQLVDERNKIAHSNGNIFFRDQTAADHKITGILQQIGAIQNHMRPVVHDCLGLFLENSWNSDKWQYVDQTDQIREVLVHPNYFSQKNIEACLIFDINSLSDHEHFEAIKELFEAFVIAYRQDEG